MAKKTLAHDLGRRERQIMDAIFKLEAASVGEAPQTDSTF